MRASKTLTTSSFRLLSGRTHLRLSYRFYTSTSEQANVGSSSSNRFDTTFLFENKLAPDAVKSNITKYKSDAQVLARWLDISVTHRQGKAYELPPVSVVSGSQSFAFPALECYQLQSLLGNQRNLFSFPTELNANKGPKIVLFSFKQYGFGLLRNWLDVLLQDTQQSRATTVPIYEICFIEYSFLSMAKKMFAKNISSAIMQQQVPNTFLKFGEIAVRKHLVDRLSRHFN